MHQALKCWKILQQCVGKSAEVNFDDVEIQITINIKELLSNTLLDIYNVDSK